MAALMRSTDEEIESNCRLVRDVIASQKAKRETILRFEELFKKWKRGEPIEQIQAEHDERLLRYWSNLSRISKGSCILKSGTNDLKLPCDISQF